MTAPPTRRRSAPTGPSPAAFRPQPPDDESVVSYVIPASATPTESEEHALAAALAEGELIGFYRRWGVHWTHFIGERTRPIAEAMWRLSDPEVYTPPRRVEKANVIAELRLLGYWETSVSPSYLTALDKRGTTPVVKAAQDFAETVLAAASARSYAEECVTAARTVLQHPADLRSVHSTLVDQTGRIVTHVGRDADYSVQALNAEALLAPVPSIPYGIPLYDVLMGGLAEGEFVGYQGLQKGGKTRSALWSLLEPLLAGTPMVAFTTDNTAAVLRNRLVALIATAWMAQVIEEQHVHRGDERPPIQVGGDQRLVKRGWDWYLRTYRADKAHWTLDARRLDLSPTSKLLPIQKDAIRFALAEMNSKMQLWIMDPSHGIQDFSVLHDQLLRHLRAPFSARLIFLDHFADLTYRGSNDVAAFQYIVRSMKTTNAAHRTTLIGINQRSEAGNKNAAAGGGGGYGSYNGGVFPASVDHLIEPNDGNTDKDKFVFYLRASRWTGEYTWTYKQNPASGLVLNPRSYPKDDPAIVQSVRELAYMRAVAEGEE